jgi:hypothetical protein
MRVEKINGKNGYYLYFKYNNDGECVESGDSDGKTARHFYDEYHRLVRTEHKTGFWKCWKYESDKTIYNDSDGVTYKIDAPYQKRGFHGTSLENAENIKEHGYDKNHSMFWPQSTGNMYCFISSEKYSAEHCMKMAEKFALKTSNNITENAAIVEIDVEDLILNKCSVDCHDPSFEILSEITPDKIVNIHSLCKK